jgi:hypothetical protein
MCRPRPIIRTRRCSGGFSPNGAVDRRSEKQILSKLAELPPDAGDCFTPPVLQSSHPKVYVGPETGDGLRNRTYARPLRSQRFATLRQAQ